MDRVALAKPNRLPIFSCFGYRFADDGLTVDRLFLDTLIHTPLFHFS
jgi:hypothetical protein